VVAKSSESSVEFLFLEIKLRNRVILVATIYRPPNTSVVYHSLDGEYGLQVLKEICSNLLPSYGKVCLLGDFHIDLLASGYSLFPLISIDFLEMFMLCNVAILPMRGASGKFLNLFLVSNPNDVGDVHQITVPWSDHDMIFLSCCIGKSSMTTLHKHLRSFRDIDRDGLFEAAASLDWSAVWFMADEF
jgi:hypothetical protein